MIGSSVAKIQLGGVHADLRCHALGRQQRRVGAAHQVAGGTAHLADGHAHGHARSVPPVLHAHRILDAMGEAMPGVCSVPGQDRGELVTAEPVARGGAVGRAHRSGDGTDALVADRVAEALVRLLEPVEIEHDEADAALREGAGEVVVERPAIAQPCQRIGDGGLLEVGQLGVGSRPLPALEHAQQHEQRPEEQEPRRERGERESPGVVLRSPQRGERARGRAALRGGDALQRALGAGVRQSLCSPRSLVA